MKVPFSYEEAVSRNIGWITEWEQQVLRAKKVAIAGMGGVGGVHLLTLVRLGVGSFHIADFDHFEVANFNRQVGATMATVGGAKVDVLAASALDINPEARICRWPRGIGDADIDAFLEGVDLYVDGLDFFVIDIRIKVFERCRALGIPAITAGPIGFGTGYIVFMPDGMSFEQYFRFGGLSNERQYVNFYMGLVPKALQRRLLVDPTRLDLKRRTGPSSIIGCQLCAGVAGAEAVKILLNRGVVRDAPYYHQFDAFRGKLVSGKLRWGNAGPFQRLKIAAASSTLARAAPQPNGKPAGPPESGMNSRGGTRIERILDLARWAPSGDNSQPWRFAIQDERTIGISIHEQSAHDVYDYGGGQPSLISGGMLLETIRIAASAHGHATSWDYRGGADGIHRIEVQLGDAPPGDAGALLPYLTLRSVDRRPYRRCPLNKQQKVALQAAVEPDLGVLWFESLAERWSIARLNGLATDIRLRIPEAYTVHQRILDWDRDRSPHGIPAAAIGLDAATLRLMRWAMRDWDRVDRMNRLPGATFAARLQMDYLPGLACGAHFAIRRRSRGTAGDAVPSLLRAGEALQRLWLTATQMGLALQPSRAPLSFAHYGRSNAPFTANERIRAKASLLAEHLDRVVAASASGGAKDILFLGRIGNPKTRTSGPRSIRRPLDELLAERPAALSDRSSQTPQKAPVFEPEAK